MNRPNWLLTYERYKDREWGFVAFKVGSHTDADWTAYKEKLDQIVRLPFRTDDQAPGATEAAEYFRIHWIEDAQSERAEAKHLQEQFAEIIPNLSAGMAMQLFLVATPQSVSHLLASTVPDDNSQRWRSDPPYILAVSSTEDPGLEEDHEEREWFQEVFKVAAETVVDELWFVLEGLSMPVRRVTRGIRGAQLRDGEESGSQTEPESNTSDLADVWWSSGPSPEQMRRRRQLRFGLAHS